MTSPRLILVSALVLGMAAASTSGAAVAGEDEPARKQVIERVVAVVNDTIILSSELDQRLLPYMPELQKLTNERDRKRQLRTLERQALDEMIEEELVLQAAAASKLEVTNAEVDKAVDEVKKQNKVTDAQLAQALAAQGYSMAAYRADVRKQIIRLRAINIMVRPRVAVTDDEVREHYDKLLGKTSAVREVHVQHILVKLPEKPVAADLDAARRRAGELVARARGGEDFADLARASSQDEVSRGAGGDMGWFKRGELPTEWEEILFGMTDGEVRGPVRGPKGLHIFRVAETRREEARPFEEIKEQLRNQIYNEELAKQSKLWVEELRKRAHVETKL